LGNADKSGLQRGQCHLPDTLVARASPGCFISAKRTAPDPSTRNVPRVGEAGVGR